MNSCLWDVSRWVAGGKEGERKNGGVGGGRATAGRHRSVAGGARREGGEGRDGGEGGGGREGRRLVQFVQLNLQQKY